MPALFVFLFKVNIALLLFCAGYYLVLRRLTFYRLNRVYLITAIVFASLYPEIDLSGYAKKHETLTRPIQSVALIWQAPAEKLVSHPDHWYWAGVVFWAGAALLAMRLLMQLFSLLKLRLKSQPAQILNHKVRLISGEAAPFSFWQSIYINPANHNPADLKAILLHEQVHVNDWHTIDVLLAELSSIFYWFNPGIWLIKKAVRENIEFITDRKILNKGFDSKAYQYSLVNVSFNSHNPGIVNHFNISTIKKRIIMMNAKKSSRFNLTRYAFVVPAIISLLLVFTLSKAAVTKPITIEISKAVQPVTTAIKKAAVTALANTRTAITGIKKDTAVKTKITFTSVSNTITGNGKTDSVHLSFSYNKPDTGTRPGIIINGTGIKNGDRTDTVNFVVDGKKISSAAFKNISPDKIAAVNILYGKDVNNIIGADKKLSFNNNRPIVSITTTDSEAGKKIVEKRGKFKSLSQTWTNIIDKNTVDGIKTGNVKTLTTKEGGVRLYTSNLPKEIAVVNGLNGNTELATDSISIRGIGKVNLSTPPQGVIVRTFTNGDKVTTNQVTYTYNNEASVKTVDPETGAVITPYSMKDKLIIIDGMEASEKAMKKISAFDIDRINTSTDKSVINKYGDKAKNGVVYIYTKKRNKK